VGYLEVSDYCEDGSVGDREEHVNSWEVCFEASKHRVTQGKGSS